jgi:hypothetical protein
MTLVISQPVANLLTISAAQPEFTGLVTAQSFIAADVTLTTLNQFYTVTTLSLTAGTWLVMGQCQFYSATAGATSYTMRVITTAGATVAESSSMHPSQAGGVANANIAALLTLTSSTTLTMQALANSSSRTVRYLSFPSGTYNATGMCAVKVSA